MEEDPETKKPRIVLGLKEGDSQKKVWPEEVSALVLEYLKVAAEDILLKKVTKAIVTVPAYFNDR